MWPKQKLSNVRLDVRGGRKEDLRVVPGVWLDELGWWQGHLWRYKIPGEYQAWVGKRKSSIVGEHFSGGTFILVLTISNVFEWHLILMHLAQRFYQAISTSSSNFSLQVLLTKCVSLYLILISSLFTECICFWPGISYSGIIICGPGNLLFFIALDSIHLATYTSSLPFPFRVMTFQSYATKDENKESFIFLLGYIIPVWMTYEEVSLVGLRMAFGRAFQKGSILFTAELHQVLTRESGKRKHNDLLSDRKVVITFRISFPFRFINLSRKRQRSCFSRS